MNLEFWKQRRVLITGHTGFKGSWLSLWLQHLGAEVTGYSLPPPTTPSLYELANIKEGMTSVHGDVRDLDHVKQTMVQHRPEVVFHMAAQSLVYQSYQDPIETYETNVIGTAKVLEAVRKVEGVKGLVAVTSDKCYANREWVWGYREDEPMGGYDPYSSSKGCAELVTAAYRQSFFNSNKSDTPAVQIASARAGNVIGGGDWAENRLVPEIVQAAMAGRPALIRNPEATRPWQHVLDPLSGYMLLAEKLCIDGPGYAEGWNFGPRDEDAKSVAWIAQRLTEIWKDDSNWKVTDGEYPHEAHYLKLDCSKAAARLGWHPRWNIDQALAAVVQWYKGYQSNEELRELMIRQIENYLGTSPGLAAE